MPSDRSTDDTEHIITITSVLKHQGAVSDPERLLGNKKHVNLHGEERRVGVALDIVEELRCSYECSCGERFLKDQTAADHLRESGSVDTATEQSGGETDV